MVSLHSPFPKLNKANDKIGEANKILVKEDNEIKISNISYVSKKIVINKTSKNPIVEVGNSKVDRDINRSVLENRDNNNNSNSNSNKKDNNLSKAINRRGNLIIRNHFVKLNFVRMKLQSCSVVFIHITRIIS